MAPPSSLRLAGTMLCRKARSLVVPALLSGAVVLLLMASSGPQRLLQQQTAALRTVRQPAALRRNARDHLALVSSVRGAGSAQGLVRPDTGQSETLSQMEHREGDDVSAAEKRSYVSGQRFVDFDPAEDVGDQAADLSAPSSPSLPSLLSSLSSLSSSSSSSSPSAAPAAAPAAAASMEAQSQVRSPSSDSAAPATGAAPQPVGGPPGSRTGISPSQPTPPRTGHSSDSNVIITAGTGSGGDLQQSPGVGVSAETVSPTATYISAGISINTRGRFNPSVNSTSDTNSRTQSGVRSIANSGANAIASSNIIPSASGSTKSNAASSADSASGSVATSDGESALYQLPGCSCSRRYSPAALRTTNGTRSNCGGTADLRGPRQNVIAFSFYGNASSVFFGGIEANLRRVPHVYPGWVVRVYHDIDLRQPQQQQLVCNVQCRYDNVDFCDVRALPGLGDLSNKFGMIWRFMPLADESVERFIVRDLDSLIGSRERAAVDDWIASNRTFHAMRDAPAHGTEILGGMWGGWNRYNSLYSRVRDRIIKVTQWKFKGLDQRVLTVVLWPLILKHRDLIAHDSYLCYYYPMSRPFPTQRESPYDFVGSPSLLYDKFRLKSHCPYFCRPREHRDWKWC